MEKYAHITKTMDKSIFFDYIFNDRKLKTAEEKMK